MVYLADWFSAQKYNTQLTGIHWYFDHYGPYVSDVYDEAIRDRKLTIKHDVSAYGSPKEIIALKNPNETEDLRLEELDQKDKEILEEVIESTKYLYWSEFIDYVYSTYPIRTSKRYSNLNLVQLAQEEKRKS
jgi:hypothetical protein